MLMSMTGFSTRTITLPIHGSLATITLSLKTVNGRFFEATCKLPYALANLETECTKILKQQLKRGSVYLTVHAAQPAALKGTLKPSLALIKNYLTGLSEIQETCKLPGTITINDLLPLPYLFESGEDALDDATMQHFLQTLTPLIHDLIAERKREGAALEQDLMGRIKRLRELMAQIAPRARHIMAERKEQLLEQFKPFLNLAAEDTKEQQLLTIYQQLDKLDIHEEMVRFTTHLDHLEASIAHADEEKGKRLDFTLQELFREINTMAAKCTDAQISSATIAMKVEVEKAREQVQNIV